MGYVLALPEAMCDILLKYIIHILEARYELLKNARNIEIIFYNYWTKIPQNCQGAPPSLGVQTTNPIQNVKRINNFMDEP